MTRPDRPARILLAALLLLLPSIADAADDAPAVAVAVDEAGRKVSVSWPIAGEGSGRATFSLDPGRPLVESLAIQPADGPAVAAARGLDLAATLTVGSRDLKQPAGWVAFFDNTARRPHDTHPVRVGLRRAEVTPGKARATVSLAEVDAGPFRGDLRFTFYAGSPLILVEAVVRTGEDGRAIVYDLGVSGENTGWTGYRWAEPSGAKQARPYDRYAPAEPIAVAGRAIAAESGSGASLAVFPAPHRFFYPQDEAFNLRFAWLGRDFGGQARGPGLGIRQSLSGDRRFTPWFNAPPGTDQHLGAFLLVARGGGDAALDRVARYTHGDRYPKVDGHRTFTSHYHVEHTEEFLRKQAEQKTSGVPRGLETPGMVQTFRARGVDIVHLAEFHNGETPNLADDRRLPQLRTMHAECERLSDETLLVLPGEEANVHLGGHWLSFFPKPVYWVLNRPEGRPFVEDVPGVGPVYRVGSPADVLRLMEAEGGLMWTAHPRIKGSFGFPDRYRDAPFYRSPHFLGAAWKAMPADLSRPTLGWRSLDLLDDLSNGGDRKQLVAEADLFRMEPDMETYAHMNINYLRLDAVPRFRDGWGPVLDALRGGRFFSSTGEILIPEFTAGGLPSGETLDAPGPHRPVAIRAKVRGTFPLSFAEVISGDGTRTYRERIDLSGTPEFAEETIALTPDLAGRTWVRFEVWDVAANGAWTQPVWIGPAPR